MGVRDPTPCTINWVQKKSYLGINQIEELGKLFQFNILEAHSLQNILELEHSGAIGLQNVKLN